MAVQMTKSQLIEKIAGETEVAKKDVKGVLETLATVGLRRSHAEAARKCASQPIALQSPVERAAAKPKGIRRMAHVAIEPLQRFLDEQAFYLFKA